MYFFQESAKQVLFQFPDGIRVIAYEVITGMLIKVGNVDKEEVIKLLEIIDRFLNQKMHDSGIFSFRFNHNHVYVFAGFN